MASVRDELHASLRREARKLLEEAGAMAEPSKRRAHLVRAFSLVQQAEAYRNLLLGHPPASVAALVPAEQMARQGQESTRRAPAMAKRPV